MPDLTTQLSQFLTLLYAGNAGGVLVGGGAGQVPGYSTSPSLSTLALTGPGTAGAPAVAIGDANSGWYWISANRLGLATGGTLRVDVSATAVTSGVPILFPNGTTALPGLAFSGDHSKGFVDQGINQLGLSIAGVGVVYFGQTQFNLGSGGLLGWTTGSDPTTTATDIKIRRSAAKTLTLDTDGAGGALTLVQLVAPVSIAPVLSSTAVSGLVVNTTSNVSRTVWKVTLSSAHAAFQAAALTADVTLATIPAKARVIGVIADTTTAWAGTAGTLAVTVGKTAGGAEYVVSHDVKSATVTKGLADADLGTSINRASAIQGGDLPSWTTTTSLQCRLTSGTGNLGTGAATNLTQGTTVFYIIAEQYQ